MVVLSRDAPRLLRVVDHRAHASAADHEEAIIADPVSTDDEASAPAKQPSMSQPATKRASKPAKSRTAGTKAGKKAAVRVPKRGTFGKSQDRKEEEKENAADAPASSGEKRPAEGPIFGMEHSNSNKRRTPNIHATPGMTFGKKLYGKQKPHALFTARAKDDALSNLVEDYETSSVYADLSDDELPVPRPKPPTTIPRLPANYAATSSLPSSSLPADTDTATHSPPFDDDDDDILPPPPSRPDPDTICALCEDAVDETEQLRFWALHPRTVRNQMLFCKEHKRAKAQQEYTAQGFPAIDWPALPARIRALRPELVALLRNDTPEESAFRRAHTQRLASGKAAVLPRGKARKKAPAHDEAAPAPQTDALGLGLGGSTGYYGARGKRVMMEVVSAELAEDIREVAARDPVVGRSGFAMFLQAVLVPELTLLLVMQDNEVGKGVAGQIVAQSAELGEVLNEEVGDEVRLGSEDEDDDDDE